VIVTGPLDRLFNIFTAISTDPAKRHEIVYIITFERNNISFDRNTIPFPITLHIV